jgi:type I restriction enzyme S subunit
MNADLLLAHFDRISDAPDAVSRLRRFILDLAVRGKLVEQNHTDEPASKLLTRIQTEKARLLREGKIRIPKLVDVIDDEAKLYPLPNSWVWCRLSEVGAIVGGGTPPSGDLDNFTVGGAGIAWLTPADLGKHIGIYISHGARDLTPQGLRSSSATIMPKGSVLFTSRAPIGYTAIAANDVATNQGFKSVAPYILECNLYVAIYFRAFGKWIDDKASGTTFREVSGKIVSSLPFPLPPLPEQHRIAAKVDELMAFCDRFEDKQRERENRRDRLATASHFHLNNAVSAADRRKQATFYLNNFSQLTITSQQISGLRQTILDLAVHGRLVHRSDKSVEQHNRTAVIPSDPSFPEHWSMQPLTKVAAAIVDCPHSTPKWTMTGKICVRTNQFRAGHLNLSDVRFVSEFTYLERIQRLEPAEDDILYSREGGILGIACRVPPDTQLCLGQRMMLIRAGSAIDAAFLEMVLNSPLITRIALAKTTGGAAPRINVATVKAYPVPLPPLAEQQRIVARVNELMALCETLEARLTTARKISHCLLEAVLQSALATVRTPPPNFDGVAPSCPSVGLSAALNP